MLTRHAITRRADDDGVDATVAERDYVLAHIVAHLHLATPDDGGQVVFKGGTALRFAYIENYRYSADLDFTILGGSAESALKSLTNVIEAGRSHADLPHLEIVVGPMPHIAYIGPLQSEQPRSIKLDLATDEYVESVVEGTLAPIWDDLPDVLPFAIYPLEEIGAEKLRCILQRVQCRDLYDLLRLTDELGLRLADIRPLFEQKAQAKGFDPASFPQRFEDRLARYKSRWNSEMTEHLADPPRFDDVVRLMRRHLRAAGMLGS
ncbi:MAG TPA: nucleotidyl transferase AbiEii/AbiGii toxin family protein [Acidimicrobiales bacterium]|nr:nucleotidyl transferase AbiEii/AbiGii toxin family protein [Acidimicrobiales bacterium]